MGILKKLRVFQRREGKDRKQRRRNRRNKNKKSLDDGPQLTNETATTPISSLSSSNVNTSSSSDTGNTGSNSNSNSDSSPTTIQGGPSADTSNSNSNSSGSSFEEESTTTVVIETSGDLETLLSTLTIQKEEEEEVESSSSSSSGSASSESNEEEEDSDEEEDELSQATHNTFQALYRYMINCNHEQARSTFAMIDDTSTIGSKSDSEDEHDIQLQNEFAKAEEEGAPNSNVIGGVNLGYLKKSMVEKLRKSEQKQKKRVLNAFNYLDTLCAPSQTTGSTSTGR